MKKVLLIALSLPSLLAACAVPQATGPADKNDGEVITGSRIPRKGGGSSDAVGSMGSGDYRQGQIERQGNGGMRGS